ncbi:MAG: hypothetical protein A2057_12650 [Ignavibacteria bacterium GWA2_35_9]|nr:MAG: hypothetical protein A2057_12650 [Ignavibacteria bacterium GWA2_35_9]
MKKKYILIFSFLSLFPLGCSQEPPADSEVKKRLIQYFQSVNLPFEVGEILISPQKYNGEYCPIEIRIQAKIYSEDKKFIICSVENIYDCKFYNIIYGYWSGNFILRRYHPPDSIIFKLSSKDFQVSPDRIKIVQIDSLNAKEKFYPVTVSVKKDKIEKQYTIPFSQDEFGIWKIGFSELITPEGTVKAFLSEVNKGHTDKARRYFSYDYKFGYDNSDKSDLENLFPAGSIQDIRISDVNTIADTTRLNLTVIKTNSDTFKTNLELIKLGIEWRFKYFGWDWKFKSSKHYNENL